MEAVREVIYFVFKNPFQLPEAALHSLVYSTISICKASVANQVYSLILFLKVFSF